MKTLIVLPYNQGGSQGKELHLCLNLWRKFCTFNYHFIVIGEFDMELQNKYPWVEFIYSPKIPKRMYQYNQHLDVQHCMELVEKKYKDTYYGFIWIADDNYPIKPFELEDITTVHYHNITFEGKKESPPFFWNYDKWKTRQLLDNEGLPHINYTTHYPCYLSFEKLEEIWNKFKMREESYVLEDVYFNYFNHKEPVLDAEIRLGIWNYKIYQDEFKNALQNPKIKFICNSVDGWCVELEKDLERIMG